MDWDPQKRQRINNIAAAKHSQSNFRSQPTTRSTRMEPAAAVMGYIYNIYYTVYIVIINLSLYSL